MPLVASDSGSTPRVLIPSGTHIARCISVIDLGTQDDTYMGEPKLTHQVRLTWELPFETRVFDEAKGAQPFWFSKKYTVSLGDKANLRRDLESWRGRPFTEEELKGFDLNNILDKPCQLNILHKLNQSGQMRERLGAITPLAKGMTCPPASSELVSYDVAQGRDATYNNLHKFIQEDIAKCHEWRVQSQIQEQIDGGQNGDGDGDFVPF